MKQRVIIITGTSKGIGQFLAKSYLQGGDIVVGCSRGQGSIVHKNYRHFSLEVSHEREVIKMVRLVKKEFKRVDILLNNAAIASMNHFLTTSLSTVERIFSTNFIGTFLFSREVAKIMMKQKYGKIINYTTIAVALNLEGEAIYGASKSAIENLTQTIAKELAPFNITVNAIGPTPTQTDLIKAIPKDKIKILLEKQAIKRFATFDDIKNVVDFFVDEKSDFITGQIIYLGGV
jgi:3-oxoacyl-[acyl-carrier protein] reductase